MSFVLHHRWVASVHTSKNTPEHVQIKKREAAAKRVRDQRLSLMTKMYSALVLDERGSPFSLAHCGIRQASAAFLLEPLVLASAPAFLEPLGGRPTAAALVVAGAV